MKTYKTPAIRTLSAGLAQIKRATSDVSIVTLVLHDNGTHDLYAWDHVGEPTDITYSTTLARDTHCETRAREILAAVEGSAAEQSSPRLDPTGMERLRQVRLTPYLPGHESFTLTLWDTRRMGPHWHSLLAYRLTMNGVTLFEGQDYGVGAYSSVDGDDAVMGCLTFLCLKPGDTDREYFENYSSAQLEFCASHAESLELEAMNRFRPEELEEEPSYTPRWDAEYYRGRGYRG